MDTTPRENSQIIDLYLEKGEKCNITTGETISLLKAREQESSEIVSPGLLPAPCTAFRAGNRRHVCLRCLCKF